MIDELTNARINALADAFDELAVKHAALTAVLGAILLTGYLGGAVAANLRIGSAIFNTFFPIVFAALAWTGLYLRESRLGALIPFRT